MKKPILVASLTMMFALSPLVASASAGVCNASLFSQVTSPIAFAQAIGTAATQTITTVNQATGAQQSQAQNVCIAYYLSPTTGDATCTQWQTSGSGTSQESQTGTQATIAAGEQELAHAQELVMRYQQLQMKLCSLTDLQGFTFSAFPGKVQQIDQTMSSLFTSQHPGTDAQPAADTYWQLATDDGNQLNYLGQQMGNVNGETGALEMNAGYLELIASQQHQQMLNQYLGGAQAASMAGTGPGMAATIMQSMFDVNEDPSAGWSI